MGTVRLLVVVITGLFITLGADLTGQLLAPEEENFGFGNPATFIEKYRAYREQQLKSATPSIARIRLGYVKGLSRSFTGLAGDAAIDLTTGTYRITLNRLTFGQKLDVSLVDRRDDGDVVARLVTITALGSTAVAVGAILGAVAPGFAIDRVIVTDAGDSSKQQVLAAGSLNVFEKLFFRRLSLTHEKAGLLALVDVTVPPLFASLVPDLAEATAADRLTAPAPIAAMLLPFVAPVSAAGGSVPADVLISQGAKRFFEKTFDGNGRTCGTCHRAENNLTIDKAFIATLPLSDPLFVAQTNPALTQLEKPVLMREFGLILENVDGLEDPTNKFTMRGVPHTLGLQASLTADATQLPTAAEMTGWSGDGAPGTGSLREFANGAVTQHFTKRLDRVPGVDFTLPGEHDLDAMEAFQLSLGRSEDFNLLAITFLDTSVDDGKVLFLDGTGNPEAGGRCATCHGNAGALAANGQNRNFNTNVEDVPHPARGVQSFPFDGGFGRAPINPNGSIGNLAFNTASVVEAADTPPFFHNNVVETLDGVMGFYTGPQFNNPARPPAARFSFDATQREQLTDFMRAINALDNINTARRELAEILTLSGNAQKEAQTRLASAFFDTRDAIRVLNEGEIFAAAVTRLTAAQLKIVQAQQTNDVQVRRARVQEAIAELDAARATMVAP